ncbi:hypothetical protein SNOG_20007 [Parastagonospora nodorum SN15]|uniref:Uncharacterized protein n=1 Tax=Phaeosphaeria nodorum (strain SN15 / ATCC MYA-4574 / FGSC 10173) TaxID=321614 RepID=A9JU01_PHANO|nr:hypothetical protein SNOG_20007 [Parastagonospora nodorum SN15]EDP89757.1 hypothetical protein SNOG_20007 [Parastagonospora nodorum SN15]
MTRRARVAPALAPAKCGCTKVAAGYMRMRRWALGGWGA